MAQYFFIKNNERLGPFELEQLLQNGLTPDSLVWCQGMANWTKAADVADLAAVFAPPMPQAPVQPTPPPAPAAPVPPAEPVAPVQPAAPAVPEQPVAPAAPAQPAAPAPQAAPAPAAPQYQQPAPQYQQPAPQYQQPAPQYQQPWGTPPPQQGYPPFGVKQNNNQDIFKIILYVILGGCIVSALFQFFASFGYFSGWFRKPSLGIFSLLNAISIIAVCAYAIMKMVKNEKFGFITIAFFALAFILNLFGLIFGLGSFYKLFTVAGLAMAVLASVPMDKIGDIENYKSMLSEATIIDYVLLGAYFVTSLIYLILCASFIHSIKHFSL